MFLQILIEKNLKFIIAYDDIQIVNNKIIIMDDVIKKKCFVCNKLGRIRTGYDPNGQYDTMPIVRCFTQTSRCCGKYIYVHDAVQQNWDIKLDCEKIINAQSNAAFQNGVCLLCKKRLYWNVYERAFFGLLFLALLFLVGSTTNPTSAIITQILIGTGIVFGFVFLAIILFVWLELKQIQHRELLHKC